MLIHVGQSGHWNFFTGLPTPRYPNPGYSTRHSFWRSTDVACWNVTVTFSNSSAAASVRSKHRGGAQRAVAIMPLQGRRNLLNVSPSMNL